MGVGFPDGALSADSPFYILRPPIEERVLAELQWPGSLVRIRAAPKMGKSSLLVRSLQALTQHGYRTALIDFRTADRATFTDLPRFLRWLCAAITHQLQLPLQMEPYWDDFIGAKLSCTHYLSQYLLPAADTPLVLALNEVNKIFAYPDIAEDVLALLRFWYEEAKHNAELGRLRQVVVHSTDVYVPLNIHQSPFNVGLPIQLPPFTLQQVGQLAQRYGVTLAAPEIAQLVERMGGHPYLSAIALYHLSQTPTQTLTQLLKDGPTSDSIYGHHLRSCRSAIEGQPALQAALQQLQTGPVALPVDVAYPLSSLGVILSTAAGHTYACDLYRRYFSQITQATVSQAVVVAPEQTVPPSAPAVHVAHVQQLKQENQRLKELVNIDGLTRIANRRYMDCHMQIEWQRMINSELPLSLIILDIDCFKQYNDTYGHRAGDQCLQQVASALRNSLNRPADLAARYGGEEFAVILPMTNPDGAKRMGHVIHRNILALQIVHESSTVPEKVITVSVGVATTWPGPNQSPEHLFAAADSMMYESKRRGRNRVTLSQHRTPIAS